MFKIFRPTAIVFPSPLQVNSDLPVTAYIKMVDVWLIFNLIIPFVLIVIHTYMDTLRP